MNRIALLILLGLTLGLQAADSPPIQRLKRMIEMREPVEGKLTLVQGGTNKVYEFGIQPRTWFIREPDDGSGRGLSSAAGQSYSMTWVVGGNSVHAMPIEQTPPLVPLGDMAGKDKPAVIAEQMLVWLHAGARFSMQTASTNIEWSGLRYKADGIETIHRGKVRGELVLEAGRPKRITRELGDQVVSTEFIEWDQDGFPTAWVTAVDGKPKARKYVLSDLKWGTRDFPESDGYTPTVLGESGREFAIFYSNHIRHVVGENGSFEAQADAPLEAVVQKGRGWIWFGVVGLVVVITATAWRMKR